MKELFKVKNMPLIGCIGFGLIDRGTNLIQIRPCSDCPLDCIFCSTDNGKSSKTIRTNYIVDLDLLVEYAKEIAKFKSPGIEFHIDSVGEPTTYKKLLDLVNELSDIKNTRIISMQTHGTLLTKEKIKELDECGLSRVNLSIDSLNPELAKKLSNTPKYDIESVKETAKAISNSNMDLMLTPIWVPGLNDNEIPKIIKFGKKLKSSFGIQKFEIHKHGRKPVKPISWKKFNEQLKIWEKEFNVKLIISEEDFNIRKRKSLPIVFKRKQKIFAKVVGPGWLKREMLAVSKGRVITILNCDLPVGSQAKVRIISNKHNIYIGCLC